MKIIGYGICGPGEAGRYLKETLEEFKRLCDTVVILCNNTGPAEHKLIDEYGFTRVSDRREWGKWQWKIKQDFIERDIKKIAEVGDMLVCLDMDEVFDPALDREWITAAPFDAYHVFVVDLWNDPEHFKPESCFWNVRMWRWNGETSFKVKPVHCGLAPEWTYLYHRHAPFYLKHYGLMLADDRARKLERYAKYDPHAEHLDQQYYDMLKDDRARLFDPEAMQKEIEEEVKSYNQKKPTESMNKKPKDRFAYVKNPHGEVIDIPERHVDMTLKRGGFEFIGWADEQDKEIDELFADNDDSEIDEDVPAPEAPRGSYQRSPGDEKKELDARNAADDKQLSDADIEGMLDEGSSASPGPSTTTSPTSPPKPDDHPKPDPNKIKVEGAAKNGAAKKVVAKTS